MTIKSAHNRKLSELLRKLGWDHKHGTVRRRIYDLAICHHPWWDWGHRLMILTGADFGGNWDKPSPQTLWYNPQKPKRMWKTGYPLQRFQVVRDYKEFVGLTDGIDVNSDEHYAWKAIGTGQDDELHLGRMYWGGAFYGLTHGEMRLLTRWLLRWEITNWFGVRSWLYSLGLHAAVYRKKPFSCAKPPHKGSGGYSHWLCTKPRRHNGLHQYEGFKWASEDLVG